VARTEDAPEDAGLCDLPVGMDDSQERAFVSHRNGKHAQTRFEPGRACGRWRVWAAHTPFPAATRCASTPRNAASASPAN
jgi:23S rRNA-/tRNA-specific pseudouridylate synthase